jgi:hypothetical protein
MLSVHPQKDYLVGNAQVFNSFSVYFLVILIIFNNHDRAFVICFVFNKKGKKSGQLSCKVKV